MQLTLTSRHGEVNEGTNELISLNDKLISVALKNILKNPKESIIPAKWDGNATHRILEIISKTN